MNYLLLLITVFTNTSQNILTKEYSRRNTNGPITFGAMGTVAALIVFLFVSRFQLHFVGSLWLYAFFFAITYAMAIIGTTIAIGTGPLSITTLITSYSLTIPALYGIIFSGDSVTVLMILGFVFLAISLACVNIQKNKDGEKKKINIKWIIAVIISFVGNGMCSTVQRIQQIDFEGAYKNEFMILALLMASVIMIAAAFILERKQMKLTIQKGWFLSVFRGFFNGITNILVMTLGNLIAVSILFPVISGGTLVISAIASIVFYKEKLSDVQIAGVILGTVSVVLLNL